MKEHIAKETQSDYQDEDIDNQVFPVPEGLKIREFRPVVSAKGKLGALVLLTFIIGIFRSLIAHIITIYNKKENINTKI